MHALPEGAGTGGYTFPEPTSILVTGAASGIGEATARLLAARGAAIVAMDLSTDRIERLVQVISSAGGRAVPVVGSVTDPVAAEQATRLAVSTYGQLDGLIHCAGVGGGNAEVLDMTVDQWTDTMAVNATGTFVMNQAAARVMVPRGYGRIVNMASIAGLEGNPRASHYSSSKAAVIAFTKAFGKELATTGVLVNAVAPALIETDLLRQVTQQQLEFMLQKIPMGRAGRPIEVARLISFLISPELSFSTGAVYDLSGGRATY